MTRYYLGIEVTLRPATVELRAGWAWAEWPDGRCFKHWADQLETTPWGVEAPDPDGCWFWLGHLSRAGYGRFWLDGKEVFAHRVAYELFVGPFPSGLVTDHLCRNRSCVCPAHLEAVTITENTRRGDKAPGKFQANSECPAGHRLEGDNLRVNARGHRECLTCRRENRRREYREKNSAAPPETLSLFEAA